MAFSVYDLYEVAFSLKYHLSLRPTQQRAARQERPGAPNENIIQNHLNIALLNVF